MTEAEVAYVEAALGVSFPAQYRAVLLNYPADLLDVESSAGGGKFAADMLYYEPDWLIDRNQTAREMYQEYVNGSLQPWPTRFVAIGNNGGGDEWCIDVADPSGAVWQWEHECGSFRVAKSSVQAHIEDLRRYFLRVRERNPQPENVTTAEDWKRCADPARMLEYLKGRASDRKLRLFACACVRRIEHRVTAEALQKAIGIAEQFADGRATTHELALAREGARTARISPGWLAVGRNPVYSCTFTSAFDSAYRASIHAARPASDDQDARVGERANQVDLLRDIFGVPFGPVVFQANWRTAAVRALAQELYDRRVFDRLPILADALQEVGCEDTAILDHCRKPGEHVLGCWVVDLVLGKT